MGIRASESVLKHVASKPPSEDLLMVSNEQTLV